MTVCATLALSLLLGRFIGLGTKLSLLLGVGTSICGASAIMAASKTINASKEDIAVSIALVNALGSIGIILLPSLSYALDLGDSQAAVLIGGSLQAVGHVTAAGFSINNEVGTIATFVKLFRVMLLVPLILILGIIFKDKKSKDVGAPFFIIGFFAMILASNLGLFNHIHLNFFSQMMKLSLAIAMSAIGLKIKFGDLTNNGKNALGLSTSLFLFQTLSVLELSYIITI